MPDILRREKALLFPSLYLGLVPLMFASGAGSVGNRLIGTGAVGGMLIGTLLGVFAIPALFVVLKHYTSG
ncbi:MAG TPA: efflux RND transporter permease subunit [Pedobacter sp.]|jgi:multidrug efflux pump subunit AcrB